MTGLCCVFAVLLLAGPARAATYGASTFSGSAEGWTVKSATCSIPVTCSASGGYDGTAGNPAGSLAANSTILVNLIGLFKTTVVTESSEFKVGDGGTGTLRLQRQFAPGDLLALAPSATYSVALVDKTSGTESKSIGETISAESGFTGKEGPATLVSGHVYAIRTTTEVSSTLVGLSTGTASVRFDNVSVTGPGANSGDNGDGKGGDGGRGGDGGNGLSDVRLLSLMQSSLGSAQLKGKRLFVKAKCPAKVGRTCKITVQGLLKKGKPATTKRTAKVAKGKAKRLVLKVKPAVKSKVVGRKRLLFKESVRAGPAKATVYRSLALIKR
jgi:hypothetical protein